MTRKKGRPRFDFMNRVFRDLAVYLSVILVIAYAFYIANSPRFTPEASVQWSKIPPDVQEQITVHADGGEIREINDGVRRNKVYYRATAIAPDGQKITIKVDETGKLIGLKYDDDEATDCKSEEFQPTPSR